MRPASKNYIAPSAAAASIDGGFKHWNSPIPFLFGGLGLMLGLITMALLILACSYKKPSPTDHQEENKSEQVKFEMEMEPKIVVIMAGHHNPTYLANPKPVTCTCQPTADQQV